MSSFKTVALSLAVVLASAITAQAATTHKPAHHTTRHSTHTMRHSDAMAGGQVGTRGASSADHSADQLNAQSLTRSQGAQGAQ